MPAAISRAVGVDSNLVMKVLRSDRKLNVSEAYLHPGFAFGGSCLPKDLTALIALAASHNLPVPMLASLKTSNESQIHSVCERILCDESGPIGMLGISFKPGTGDLRDSPYLELARVLCREGTTVIAFDEMIDEAKLNAFVRENGLSDTEERLVLAQTPDLLECCSMVIIAHPVKTFSPSILHYLSGKRTLDICNDPSREEISRIANYEGLYW